MKTRPIEIRSLDIDELGDLLIFVRLAELHSFTATAERLGISKGSVSARLSRLERRLGLTLFTRTTRSISLTDAGRLLYERAGRALSEMSDGLGLLDDLAATPRGVLRVSMPMAVGRRLVGPHLAAFVNAHPAVSLEVTLSDDLVNLAAEGFDLAIRHTASAHDTHMVWPLRRIAWRLVAAPGYLAGRSTPREPADLATHSCLLFVRDRDQATWRLRRGETEVTVEVRALFRSNNSEILRQTAVDGLGIACLPDFSCAEDLAAGRLVEVLPDHTPIAFSDTIFALRPWTRHVPRTVKAFVEFMRARLDP